LEKLMTDNAKQGPENLEPVVPNAKDASKYPGNEGGTVQPTTVVTDSKVEAENTDREATRRAEEKKHHEECGS
jgi:hypothetical protein